MPSKDLDRVIGLSLANPKFRKQLLNKNVDNAVLFKTYGIPPTAELLAIDKDKLADAIKKKFGQSSWCIGNACGVGT